MDYLQFVRALLRGIDEELARLDLAMVMGQCTDWPKYRELVAERRGLMKARDLCTQKTTADDKRELQEFGR